MTPEELMRWPIRYGTKLIITISESPFWVTSNEAVDRLVWNAYGLENWDMRAVKALLNGHRNEMIGIVDKEITFTSFAQSIKHNQAIDKTLVELVDILG